MTEIKFIYKGITIQSSNWKYYNTKETPEETQMFEGKFLGLNPIKCEPDSIIRPANSIVVYDGPTVLGSQRPELYMLNEIEILK